MDRSKWEYKRLGEIGNIITGGTPSTKDARNYSSNDYCFIKPSDLTDEKVIFLDNSEFHVSTYAYLNSRILPKGSVLVCCIGSIGKIGILNVDAICNQQINAIIPNPGMNSKYISYSLLASKSRLLDIANAPVVPIINKSQFSNFEIRVCPLADQQRIVAELDCLNEMIALKQEQLKEFDKLAQSIFYDMFGESDYPLRQLKDVLSKIGSGATPSGGNQSYKTEGISLIRSLNVHNNEFIYNDLAFIDDEQAKRLDNVIIEENDVLLNITGASVARCCIVPTDVLPARVNQHVSILRPYTNQINSTYLCHLFISEEEQAKLIALSKSKAATREALPKNILEKYLIKLPPLSLQQQFAEKIQAIEAQKELVKQSIAETQKLLDYTMDKYFGYD